MAPLESVEDWDKQKAYSPICWTLKAERLRVNNVLNVSWSYKSKLSFENCGKFKRFQMLSPSKCASPARSNWRRIYYNTQTVFFTMMMNLRIWNGVKWKLDVSDGIFKLEFPSKEFPWPWRPKQWNKWWMSDGIAKKFKTWFKFEVHETCAR